MEKLTKIMSVALLTWVLSMTAVGCDTTGDQSNVSSSSQSSTQDILSQDPKEVYKRVEEKMKSISSYSKQSEVNAEMLEPQGDTSDMSGTDYMELEDVNSDNPRLKSITKIDDTSGNPIEITKYILDGYKYMDVILGTNVSAKVKSPVDEEDKKMFEFPDLSSDELDNLKLEKDSEGRIVIVSGLTQSVNNAFKKMAVFVGATEGYERITIDNDYRIISSEVSAKGGSNVEVTMNIKSTYSYEPVKIEFPSFEEYVEANTEMIGLKNINF